VATTLLLARHGETDWNREQRWQGHADPGLNATGRRQAAELAERLESSPIAAVYSSDLARARETAAIVASRLGLAASLDARLREVDVGEWSGLTSADVELRYPAAFERRRLGGTGWEQGETYESMAARVVEALREIAHTHPEGRVLVVTHGGPMAAIWVAAGGERLDWQRTSNCDVDEIAVEDGEIRWIDSTRGGGLHQQVQR
jgi:2,3-bisphosphoglycerate-dependent phosphoglycerate mutase